jgi:hypothetical protein
MALGTGALGTAALMIGALAASFDAAAQSAASYEVEAVQKIAPCLTQGAPPDWLRLYMIVELDKPGDETGGVRYLATREQTPDQPEAFMPCDIRAPASALLAVREHQAPDRRRWTGARIVLLRDGSFSLGYDFPQ